MRYARASIVDEQRFNTLTGFILFFHICRIRRLNAELCRSTKPISLKARRNRLNYAVNNARARQGTIARRVVLKTAKRAAFFRFALVQEMAKIALMLIKMENEEHHKIELNVLNTFKKRKIKK
jgi:hypothetical protein